MSTPEPIDLTAYAFRVFTAEQLRSMGRIPLTNFFHLLEQRLLRGGPPPTDAELEGIAELALEHLWHPVIGRQP